MKQITEDYVSFETAKLLKEKGFDLPNSPFGCQQEQDTWIKDNSYSVPNPNYDETLPFDSPSMIVIVPHVTQSLVMKWLREEKGLYIDIQLTGHGWFCSISEVNEDNPIEDCEFNNFDDLPYFKNYEDAIEDAIEYCLKNLVS